MADSLASLAKRHAIVVGGSVTGLAAALALSRRGARVTVFERDREESVGEPAAAFATWQRPGVPQVRHSHVFLARLRNLLRQKYPDLLDAVMAAGARELRGADRPPLALRGLAPDPGDEDLVTVACRRTTFEVVLRRYVIAQGGVDFVRAAKVTGLTAARHATPIVSGVRYVADGREQVQEGHLVVDASGRRSLAPEWLRAIGARPNFEHLESSGIVYYTRFYRLHADAVEPPQTEDPIAGDFDWIKYAVFPGDDRTFSITLAVPLSLPRLKVLSRGEAFDEMVRAIPGIAPWTEPSVSEPIEVAGRSVQAMGGLINRIRRFVDDQGPIAVRFFVLGDAAYATNPLYGRGCTQAVMHGEALGEAFDRHRGDMRAAAIALDRWGRTTLEPYFHASVAADREAVRRAEGRAAKRWENRMRDRFFRDGVAIAMRCDPVVYRAFLRMLNMIETPDDAFAKPEVIARCLWVLARSEEMKKRYPVPPLPEDRETIVRRCELAAGGVAIEPIEAAGDGEASALVG